MKNLPLVDLDLRAVIYREGPWHLAHCLEMDVVAEGDTRADAIKTLIELIVLQIDAAIADGDVGSIFRPAPPEYWKLFAQSQPASSTRLGRVGGSLEPRTLVLN